MRRSVFLWSLLAVLLGGLSASAQVAPPPVEDQAASTARAAESMVTNLPENLPGLLGFTVRSKSTYIKRRHQVVRYTTSDPFEASAQRLYKLKLDGTTFGGGYYFIGWAHQIQGNKWWFTLYSPRMETYVLWLEEGEGGTAVLHFDTHIDYGPEYRARRGYDTADELGPQP